MLCGYLDETGHSSDERQSFNGMAGFLAPETEWQRLGTELIEAKFSNSGCREIALIVFRPQDTSLAASGKSTLSFQNSLYLDYSAPRASCARKVWRILRGRETRAHQQRLSTDPVDSALSLHRVARLPSDEIR